MTRLTRGSIILAALLALLALPVPAPVGAAIPAAANHDLLMLRTGSYPGISLLALPVAPDSTMRQLSPGIFDQQAHILYVAGFKDPTHSIIQALDAATGRTLRSVTVNGFYTTQSGDYTPAAIYGAAASRQAPFGAAPRALTQRRPLGSVPIDTSAMLSALSFNGRWLALRDATPGRPDAHMIVIDTATMRQIANLDLKGSFGLDAINSDGSLLYLLQEMPKAGPRAYQVRLYDLHQRKLAANPLRESPQDSSILRGVSWTRVWSPRGDWLFTLYVQDGKQGAFIHALGVEYHKVHCIVLRDPGATAAQLAHYTIAVAPDGSALYAVNPALGHVVAVHGLPYGPRVPANLVQYAGSPAHMLTAAPISPDGRTMFVATDNGVWAIDTQALALRATYLPAHSVASVALSRDGRRLYALETGAGSISTVDALSTTGGRVLGSIPAGSDGQSIEKVVSN